MKIKKLSIHGFKSFVDKSTLNFPMDVSGIIGPNGCGKSNIVDAIRWVLGEQNARHLRGKHMEDIIFNGSENRKPLGMAEVTLTFSNEDGQAPARFANFTEIEITRRLYRSGESEYYINKVQSRLRDIVDLFTDTGIGSRAYSIIEQGQVGWLINAKPEERRVIFEEAAGINKFKGKKDAALRRLEATRENLTRVSDIISEVKRQLNSLNRQAKKAERYKALREELQKAEMLLASLEFGKMTGERDSLAKRLVELKDSELALTARAAEKETLGEEVKAEYLKVETDYKALREKKFDLERQIQSEERASELARVRVDELKRNEDKLHQEINDLTERLTASSSEIESLQAFVAELSTKIESEAARFNAHAAELEKLNATLREKENAQRGERAESLKLSTRISDIRHSIQNLIRDEENLRFRESKLTSELDQTVKGLEAKEGPLNELRGRIGASSERRQAIEAELENLKSRLPALEKERTEKEQELKKLKDEFARAGARLSTLEDMERNFESLKGGAKAIMLRESKSGIHGLLADVIETNPGCERAVEALLGERLQYVMVESQKEGVDAIEYLKSNKKGRGSFVPVKDARPMPRPVPVEAGQLSIPGARELVNEIRIKEGFAQIVNSLLGDALIVENMAAALEAWKVAGQYRTIVTLEGEIIDPQGIITGGGAGGSESGILQRRNEIKKIKNDASVLESRINEVDGSLKKAIEELQSSRISMEGCRDRLHAADIEKVNLQNELKRHEDELGRLRRAKDQAEAEIADSRRRLVQVGEKKASISGERETLEKDLAERETRAAALTEEITALAAEKDRLSNIVGDIRVSLAQAKERFESVNRQITEKQRYIEETQRRLASREEEIKRGVSEIEEKSRKMEEIKAKLEVLLAGTDALKTQEIELANTVSTLGEKIRDIEAELKEINTGYSELQELKGELSIELKEIELGIGNLRERIREKYGSEVAAFRPSSEGEGEGEGEGEVGAVPDMSALDAERNELREKIASLGEVSLSALEEYNDLERRHQFLLDQQADLTKSVDALHTAIQRINRTTREKFRATFEDVNAKFKETFPKFFNGGKAELRLTEDADILEAGVEIVAQPPGKRLQNITLLSGGEKALTATSLIFAIFLIKPSPFCLLDEVDAPLDDANIDRFNVFVKEMSHISQFLLITHNKKTMEMADALYGITMEEPGVSKVLTLKF